MAPTATAPPPEVAPTNEESPSAPETDWDLSVPIDPGQQFQALMRGLRRRKGFGLFFVRCAGVVADELHGQIQGSLPDKQIGLLELAGEEPDLLARVLAISNLSELDVVVVRGIEKSLSGHLKPGYGGEGAYYSLETVPPILGSLNLQRERFRERLPCALVFAVEPWALKFFIRRAADFFDWHSGVYELTDDQQTLDTRAQQLSIEGDYNKFLSWSSEQQIEYMTRLENLLEEPSLAQSRRINLLFKLGNLSLAANYLDIAVGAYDQAVEIEPSFYEAWNNRGIALLKLERYEAAIGSYNRAVKIKPDYHDAWNNRGNALGRLERYEEAIASYQEALTIKPDFYEAWNNMGWALGNLGRYEAAVASYDRALAIKPDYQEAQNSRRWALGNLGKPDAIPGSYESALPFNPDSSQSNQPTETREALPPGNLSRAISNLGQQTPTLDLYDRTISLGLDDYETWFNRGGVLYRLGRHEEAIASYDRAIQFKPDYHEAWYGRGNELDNLGRYEEAIASFDRAIQFKPDFYQAWNNQGVALKNLGRHEEAIASFDKAIQFKPDDPEAWNNRGNVLKNLGRDEESIASYDRAIQFQPDDHKAWNNRGIALVKLGRYEEAIASYDQALQFKPNLYQAWYGKAICYVKQGQVDEAINHLRQAIKLDSDARNWAKEADSDFDPIRPDPRFQALIQEP
ncbi:hypothetical protein BCR12_09085 [Limnothrix sp. P13C2]|nr:hypothetical protein BCR12_09085 [Limnothrix sp. P13C2]